MGGGGGGGTGRGWNRYLLLLSCDVETTFNLNEIKQRTTCIEFVVFHTLTVWCFRIVQPTKHGTLHKLCHLCPNQQRIKPIDIKTWVIKCGCISSPQNWKIHLIKFFSKTPPPLQKTYRSPSLWDCCFVSGTINRMKSCFKIICQNRLKFRSNLSQIWILTNQT